MENVLKRGVNYLTTDSSGRERLRKRYRPERVQILFVGESPPASGRFFYQADSGLYRAVKETFLTAIAPLAKNDFLDSFRSLGCYLVDLAESQWTICPGMPVGALVVLAKFPLPEPFEHSGR